MNDKRIAFGIVKSADSGDDGDPGSFHVILSPLSDDRDGERLVGKAFDTADYPLPDHITFDVDHAMKVAGTVGSGRPYYGDDGALHVEGTYARTALGQETRSLVNDGHIRTTSVAFMNKKSTKAADGIREITSAELLNGAFVAVPANRDALVLSSKGLEVKAGARNNTSDKGHIQAIHDHALALGADPKGAPKTDDGKSLKGIKQRDQKAVAGSYELLASQLQDALEDAWQGNPLSGETLSPEVYATFSDHLVYCTWGRDWERQYWTAPYTLDDAGSVTIGTPTPVDIVETVVPDSDETADQAVSDGAAADPVAVTTAAVSTATVQQQQEQAAARARAVQRRFSDRARVR